MAWSEDLIKVSTLYVSLLVQISIPLNVVLSRRVLFCLFNINVTLGLTSGSILVRKLAKKMWLLPAAVAVFTAIQTVCFLIVGVRVKDDNSV